MNGIMEAISYVAYGQADGKWDEEGHGAVLESILWGEGGNIE